MRPREEVKQILVRQWLSKAEQDIRAAQTMVGMEGDFSYPACFHAQQAAEKYLKAVLTARQIEVPKIHAIEKLLDLMAQSDPDIAESLRPAAALTPYGVEIRYPSDQPEPTEQDAREAVALAEMVRKAVMAQLQDLQVG